MVNKIITDSFELLYVYIMDINRCLNDIEFSFTNEYEIEYDESQKKLIINKKNNNLQNFSEIKLNQLI